MIRLFLLCFALLCGCSALIQKHTPGHGPIHEPSTNSAFMAPMPPEPVKGTNRITKRAMVGLLPAPKPKVERLILTFPSGVPQLVAWDTTAQGWVSNYPAILTASNLDGPWVHWTNYPYVSSNSTFITNPIGTAFFRPTWEFR